MGIVIRFLTSWLWVVLTWSSLESLAHSFDMQLQKQETSLSLERATKSGQTSFQIEISFIFINSNGSNKGSACTKSRLLLELRDPRLGHSI